MPSSWHTVVAAERLRRPATGARHRQVPRRRASRRTTGRRSARRPRRSAAGWRRPSPPAAAAAAAACPSRGREVVPHRLLVEVGGVAPGSHWSAGQKRDESGVSTSSARTSSPSTRPSSNLVSAMMMPRPRRARAARSVERRGERPGLLGQLPADELDRRVEGDVLVVVARTSALVDGREHRLGQRDRPPADRPGSAAPCIVPGCAVLLPAPTRRGSPRTMHSTGSISARWHEHHPPGEASVAGPPAGGRPASVEIRWLAATPARAARTRTPTWR